MIRGLGFSPDVLAHPDGPASSYLASAAPAQTPIHYLDAIGGVGDQGQSESCVGWAFVESIALRAAALGLSLPRGSELAAWALARQYERTLAHADVSPPLAPSLANVGCSPSTAVAAIRRFGLPSQASWPWSSDPAQFVREVTLAELETADATIPLFVRSFLSLGSGGSDPIIKALMTGHAIALALPAGPLFAASGPTTVLDVPDPGPTNHMCSLVDYDPQTDTVTILNHWSARWGAGGLVRATWRFVAACDHLSIVDVTPEQQP